MTDFMTYYKSFLGIGDNDSGGIIDKFIGDEIMVIYPDSECNINPIEAAMKSAKKMMQNDFYAFEPNIGISYGKFAVAVIGTINNWSISCVGHTVNLASRCVLKDCKPGTIGITSTDINLVRQIFKAKNEWTITQKDDFIPKNMKKTNLITVHRNKIWVPSFDYFDEAKKNIKNAYKKGFIKDDL